MNMRANSLRLQSLHILMRCSAKLDDLRLKKSF